jgi:malate dehydrogenase (oxaloacetate-decarboxylating)(NADP+)
MAAYRSTLSARLDPTAASLQRIFDDVRANPKRVVFAEGEEERAIRAALAFRAQSLGTPILIGRERNVSATIEAGGLTGTEGLEIHNARLSQNNKR